jgi:hypothetical protein
MFAAKIGFFASGRASISGGNSTIDGSYTVRTFTSTDTLVVTGFPVSMTYLAVGAGGNSSAAGAAAGGNVATGSFSAYGTYTITIGDSVTGNGSSIISTVATANKGGSLTSGFNGANTMTFTGGNGRSGTFPGGGGGAGAGQNGFNSTETVYVGTNYGKGGNGGNGYQSNITGTNTYYAGGGAGLSSTTTGLAQIAIGGLGGGGNGLGSVGNVSYSAENGVVNTGGGAGGGSSGTTGGSGIIIVRYLTPF